LRRWWFESKRVPICGLDVLEMGNKVIIVDLALDELSLVRWYWISVEQSCNMLSKSIINASRIL